MPNKLRNSKKDLINTKNDDNKCLFWCHTRHLNPLKTHPEIINKSEKRMVNTLDCGDIKFPVSEKDYGIIEKENIGCINVFGYENGLVYPVHVSGKKFEDCMDL